MTIFVTHFQNVVFAVVFILLSYVLGSDSYSYSYTECFSKEQQKSAKLNAHLITRMHERPRHDKNCVHSIRAQISLKSSTSDIDSIIAVSSGGKSDSKLWPCGDELDQRIMKLTLPAMANFAILPLVGAADTFWVGRMSNALALGGQGAANQVFSSLFWICSFFPAIITPLVAKAAGSADKEKVQNYIRDAIFMGTFMGLLGMVLLTSFPSFVLKLVLSPDSPALQYARPYLAIRGLTFLPALLSTICFAAFRGTMDIMTPLKIAIASNLINIILDPILIFKFGMGVSGAAAATCVAESISFVLYYRKMLMNQMIDVSKFLKLPSFEEVKPMLLGGLGVQLRAVALNIAFLAVTRTTQALDTTGTSAAAHAITIQLWQLGGVVLLALSTVASIIVPTEVAKAKTDGKAALVRARLASDRLLRWGLVLGTCLGGMQLLCLPLLKVFSPLPDVQHAARLPSIIGAALQVMNGVVFVGEGIQQGNQYFGSLAAVTALAAVGMLTSLKLFGNTLAGVWGSFAVFNSIRLIGVLRHHYFDGPLVHKNMKLQ